MSWKKKELACPAVVKNIRDKTSPVNTNIVRDAKDAAASLLELEADAAFIRNKFSAEAESLLSIRSELDQLLASGTILTVSNFTYDIATKVGCNSYLNPNTAVKALTDKLNDKVDINALSGNIHCIALILSSSQLSIFANKLNTIARILEFRDWETAARKATALTTIENDKLKQMQAIKQPRFTPQASLNAMPLKAQLELNGTKLAILEACANDSENIISKLQNFAQKRADKLIELDLKLSNKEFAGSLYSESLVGTAESISTHLLNNKSLSNDQYTIASLILSNEPLKFWEQLLC